MIGRHYHRPGAGRPPLDRCTDRLQARAGRGQLGGLVGHLLLGEGVYAAGQVQGLVLAETRRLLLQTLRSPELVNSESIAAAASGLCAACNACRIRGRARGRAGTEREEVVKEREREREREKERERERERERDRAREREREKARERERRGRTPRTQGRGLQMEGVLGHVAQSPEAAGPTASAPSPAGLRLPLAQHVTRRWVRGALARAPPAPSPAPIPGLQIDRQGLAKDRLCRISSDVFHVWDIAQVAPAVYLTSQ